MGHHTFGVIAPHPPIILHSVGGARSEATAGSEAALRRARRALEHFDPETFVIMSPHAPGLRDAYAIDDSASFSGTLAQFGDPTETSHEGDPTLARAIADAASGHDLPAVLRGSDDRLVPGWLDHASIVPLRLLDPTGARRIVVLSLSGRPYAEHRAMGDAVSHAARQLDRRVAFIASGDLSHRLTPDAPAGYSTEARRFDATVVGLIEQGRLAALAGLDGTFTDAAGECGLRSFIALGGFCCEDPAPSRVLSYEAPWGVGYLTALIGRGALDCDDEECATRTRGAKGGRPGCDEHDVVRLARAAISDAVTGAATAHPGGFDLSGLPERAGVFVSLHLGDALRGCIGTIEPVCASIAEEVTRNAREAALSDPRFAPVAPAELGDLTVKVDVLGAAEPCESGDLDPARYGVIVTSGRRRGLLLPDLEGIDDAETQVLIAMRKAGIMPGEPVRLMRFTVERYT